jgi:hypothetical protein
VISPKNRIIVSVIAALVILYICWQSVTVGFIVVYALVMMPVGVFLVGWIIDGIDTLQEHNVLYKCGRTESSRFSVHSGKYVTISKECGKLYRAYQGEKQCPHCGWRSYHDNFVKEYYPWMDYHPDFPKHNWKQYRQFVKLGEILEKEQYEQRSYEMFMKYWEEYKGNER